MDNTKIKPLKCSMMSNLSAHTCVQNIPTGNTPHICGHFYVHIFFPLMMICYLDDDMLTLNEGSWASWLTNLWVVHGGLCAEHAFQTQGNGSIVKSCDQGFHNLHPLCCHVWNLTLCSYSRLQKEQIALLYFADRCASVPGAINSIGYSTSGD